MRKKDLTQGRIQWGVLAKRLSPYTIKKGLLYAKHYGPREFWIRLHERFEPEEIPYGPWFEAYRPDEKTLEKQRKHAKADRLRFSILVPAYKTPPEYLGQMIDSVLAQTFPFFELCIVNASPGEEKMARILRNYQKKDKRIRVEELSDNLGIAGNTNKAMGMARGEFLCFLDHDDILAPNALYEADRAIKAHPACDLLYTDEDKVTADLSEHYQPHLKPDFSLDLLRSNNYICHFLMVRRSLAKKTGGFRREYDGAQDYDFIFRVVEQAREIVHVPEILYHWRTHSSSTSDNPASKKYAFEAGKRAIEGNLSRTGCPGEVLYTQDYGFYRVKYPVKGTPLLSVIIPNKDEKETLKACLDSFFAKVSYPNYEILIVENNSSSDEIFEYYRSLTGNKRIRFLRYRHPFNYSAINNFAVRKARGEYLLFLNNDITLIDGGCIEEMLGVCMREEVGAAGAKLLYPDNTIQHAGIVIGMGGIAGSMFVDLPAERTGYLHKASLLQDVSAVTAACMMMKKQVFQEAGGFEEKLSVAFNDVDLCLRVREKGYLVVYDPYAVLYHMESRTRGAEDRPEKVRRFQEEIEYMRSRWEKLLKEGDPMYNKNLSLTKWNYSLKPLPGMESKGNE